MADDVTVRVELGRRAMPPGATGALKPGSVVELGPAPDDPVEVYVDGRLHARGVLTDVDGELCVRIEELRSAPAVEVSE